MIDEVVSKEFLEYLEVPTALHFFGIAADHGFCGIAWRHRVPFGFRLTLIYLPLFLENTQLTKAAHPILGVPGSNNFPVFEFVDIDNLDVHLPVLRRKTHEWLFLSTGHSGTDDHLGPVLENVLDR